MKKNPTTTENDNRKIQTEKNETKVNWKDIKTGFQK